jgi:hypothetical protein
MIPMSPLLAKEMTRANSPQGEVAIQNMEANKATHIGHVWDFSATPQIQSLYIIAGMLGVCCQSSCPPQEKSIMKLRCMLLGSSFIYHKQDEYLEYKRSVNFDGVFRLFTMAGADADLGGDHTRGPNANSVMSGVTFLNESHCYSYGWIPHNAGFGFLDLAPSILHSNWFWDYIS